MTTNISTIHHSISSILSISINIVIIKLSLSSMEKLIIKGEFKWIFMATSITNLIYSLLHLLFIPLSIRNTRDPYFCLYLSLSPLPRFLPNREVLSFLFQFLYSRQTMASVLSICVIPLHRVAIVCYNQKKRNVLFGKIGKGRKKIAPHPPAESPLLDTDCMFDEGEHDIMAHPTHYPVPVNKEIWRYFFSTSFCMQQRGIAAYSVNILPLLLRIPSFFFPRTTINDLPLLMDSANTESLIAQYGINATSYICHFSHNWRQTGDIIETLTDFIIIISSYLITILCILRLVHYLAHNGKERSNSVGNLERQKAILFTVTVQAILPLITFTPYLVFISSLIINGTKSTDSSSAPSLWYDQDHQFLILSWSPFINGIATLLLLKPYRRGFFGMLPCIHIVTPSNRTQAAENLRSLTTPSHSGGSTTVYRTYEISTVDDRSVVEGESIAGEHIEIRDDNPTTNIDANAYT